MDGRVIGDVGVVDGAGRNWRLIDMPISMHSRLRSSMCSTDDFFESGYTTLLGDGDPSNNRATQSPTKVGAGHPNDVFFPLCIQPPPHLNHSTTSCLNTI